MRNNSTNESLCLTSISDCSEEDRYETLWPNNEHIGIACANARSIVEKIDSLITLFEETGIRIALLTETLLTKKHCSAREMADLTIGANITFIRRDRNTRGGGVAIAYDPTKIRMNKFSSFDNNGTEIVCAAGNCLLTKRKIIAISVYLPPSISGNDLAGKIATL